jgi:hypothetical protein
MKVDMSPSAVTWRLKQVSQLRRLCLALGKAKVVSTPPTCEPGLPADSGQDQTAPPEAASPAAARVSLGAPLARR